METASNNMCSILLKQHDYNPLNGTFTLAILAVQNASYSNIGCTWLPWL